MRFKTTANVLSSGVVTVKQYFR